MTRIKEVVAEANAETLREARELGEIARIEISEGPRADACEAVRALRDRKFKLAELPSLPLAECTAQTCECTYVLALSDEP
jgi:hypothetical protein